MSGMTSDKLEELRRIASAATPGPWQWAGSRDKGDPHAYVYAGDYASEGEPDLWCEIVSECPEADAQHIATFGPTTALALLDRIEALEAVLRLVYDEFVLDVVRWCRHCRLRIDDHAPECPMAEVERVLGLAGGATDV